MRNSFLEGRLKWLHRSCVDKFLCGFSPIVSQKLGFNVSPFIDQWLDLADHPSSFWGIDRCLRIGESVDAFRSRIFHVGLFARSVGLDGQFRDPWRGEQFLQLREETLGQLFSLFNWLKIDLGRLHVTYFGGLSLGGYPDRRDRLLKRTYRFPRDEVSARFLQQRGIKATAVATIANLHIVPRRGFLVGPHLEVYYDEIEVATIVFNCYRIKNGQLAPINYLACYGIGVERLMSALAGREFLDVVPRYKRPRWILSKKSKAARCPLMIRDVREVLFGLEVLARLPPRQSPRNAALVTRMKARLKDSIHNLGLSFKDVTEIYRAFAESDPRSI